MILFNVLIITVVSVIYLETGYALFMQQNSVSFSCDINTFFSFLMVRLLKMQINGISVLYKKKLYKSMIESLI